MLNICQLKYDYYKPAINFLKILLDDCVEIKKNENEVWLITEDIIYFKIWKTYNWIYVSSVYIHDYFFSEFQLNYNNSNEFIKKLVESAMNKQFDKLWLIG